MTEMRRGQKGGYDSSTLRLQIMSHNFDYVISIDAMGGKCEFAALQPKF